MSDGEEQRGPAANLLRSLVALGGTLLAAAEPVRRGGGDAGVVSPRR